MAARHDNPAVDEADSAAGKASVSSPRDKHHQPHPYHLKNKYTFRSDSVYSDVIPMSAASQQHQTNNKSSGNVKRVKHKTFIAMSEIFPQGK